MPFTSVDIAPVPKDPEEVKVFESKLLEALFEQTKSAKEAGYQLMVVAEFKGTVEPLKNLATKFSQDVGRLEGILQRHD